MNTKTTFQLAKIRNPNYQQIFLTEREQEIVFYISLGCTSLEIAAKLFITIDTVKTHRKNAMEKLGARNAAHLVRLTFYSSQLWPSPKPGRLRIQV